MNLRMPYVMTLLLYPILLPTMLAAQSATAPVAHDADKQIVAAANDNEAQGNYAAAIREYRRLLEIYANEPALQAPVYLAMSADAEKLQDPGQAKLFADISASLDPNLAVRAQESDGKATATRGGNGKADALLSFASAALQGYVAMRQARAQQQPQQQQPAIEPSQQYAQQNSYPPASYGQQGYQAPPQYSPTPGYGDPNQQQQSGYPQQQAQYPQQQPGQYPQQQPGQYPQQSQAQYPQQQQVAPYGAPQNTGARPQTRGLASPVIKVIYDRSRFGAADHLADACGALLNVEDGNLVFTPGCGEEPRVIPAGEIWELRNNLLVGREVGAFHIITKKGLYLDVAPSSGGKDAGREEVEQLKKLLGLPS
jgi:hypothetical protein